MFLEAVTVCVGYSDFLSEAIPFNKPHFNRWLIVTTPEDRLTRALCHDRNLECLVTRDFYRRGARFDKAKGIDHGLATLTHQDWVLHIDADMVLPSHFRESLEDADLDHQCIHGWDRFMVRGWERWQRLKQSGFLCKYSRAGHHNICFPEGYHVGARWADPHQGWVPIGHGQLFHGSSVMFRGHRHRRYAPHGHSSAARTDVQHGLLWDRRHRVLLPEVVAAHLESVPGPGAKVGANWNGRTTPWFGPPGHEPPKPACS